jgi:AhpD family alkylhydroperoxidase
MVIASTCNAHDPRGDKGSLEVAKPKNRAGMSQRTISVRLVFTHQRKGIVTMTDKFDLFAAAPQMVKGWQKAMIHLAEMANFDSTISELVKLRASQINGCANCINLHAVDARENGETEQRIYLLSAWREAPCYSDRERSALGWTDALTRLSDDRERTEAYRDLQFHFTEEEQVKLTVTINIINGWNRIAVGFGLFADPAAIKASAQAVA